MRYYFYNYYKIFIIDYVLFTLFFYIIYSTIYDSTIC